MVITIFKQGNLFFAPLLALLLASCATNDAAREGVTEVQGYTSYDLENRLYKANQVYDDGLLVDAEKLFLNIVVEHRGLSDAWFKLGNIYYRSGRYNAAVNAYETVLKIDNEYEKAWYNLGLSRLSQSIEVFDNALAKMLPTSPYYLRTYTLRKSLASRVRADTEALARTENPPNKAPQLELTEAALPGAEVETIKVDEKAVDVPEDKSSAIQE